MLLAHAFVCIITSVPHLTLGLNLLVWLCRTCLQTSLGTGLLQSLVTLHYYSIMESTELWKATGLNILHDAGWLNAHLHIFKVMQIFQSSKQTRWVKQKQHVVHHLRDCSNSWLFFYGKINFLHYRDRILYIIINIYC